MSEVARRGILLVLLVAGVHSAAASSFSIAPIRVEMGPSQTRGVLTLHNESEAPVTVQVSGLGWSQTDGQDQYAATHDLLTTPPVFVVPGHGDQIVRVALRREADASRELEYRLFFEEVPSDTTSTFNGLRVSLRIGVPVFVTPRGGAASAQVTWEARSNPDGSLQVQARNAGTAHLQITDFELLIGEKQKLSVAGSKYVLPGSTVSWKVTLPAGADAAGALRVHAFTDQGEITAELARSAR